MIGSSYIVKPNLHLPPQQCSVQCGVGKKWKKQLCTRVYKPEVRGDAKRREYIDESFCVRRKLRRKTLRTTTKTCRINCKWNTSDWTRCPADCSEEYQTRYVRCEAWQDKRSEEVPEDQCDAKKRPSKRRICDNCVQRQSKVIMKVRGSSYIYIYPTITNISSSSATAMASRRDGTCALTRTSDASAVPVAPSRWRGAAHRRRTAGGGSPPAAA